MRPYLRLSPSPNLYTVWLSIGSHSTATRETGLVTKTVGDANPAPAAFNTMRLASLSVKIFNLLKQIETN